MAKRLISPEFILPTRMTLHVPANTDVRFSILNFPYANAFKMFMRDFEEAYRQKYGDKERLPFQFRLPSRQLNDALLTLAPSLIQGFESGKKPLWTGRMVAFTRYGNDGRPEDFPSQEQLHSLIRHWLERWSQQSDVQALLQGDGRLAWQTLLKALNAPPETEWEHEIMAQSLSNNLKHENSLAFIGLPALLSALLHGKTMTIQSEKHEYVIRWRRANQGGKDGLHLVSQPFAFQGDYFAYRLDFSVQTQVGYAGFWIFAYISIQRYIAEQYRGGDKSRNISVLVGYNREGFTSASRWEDDTTLIRLGIDSHKAWEGGVGKLLDDFSVRPLIAPEVILNTPSNYGNYLDSDFKGENEYYVVFAEGRKFGDASERGRDHQVKTGTSLRERSQIMEGVLNLLGDWLTISPPLERDIQNPLNTLALRDYDHMVKKRKTNVNEAVSWRNALQTSLSNSDCSQLHIVVVHRTDMFAEWAGKQIDEALIGVNKGDTPQGAVTYEALQPMLYTPLDSGNLDPQMNFKPSGERPKGFTEQWKKQMRDSHQTKREDWRKFLRGIQWQPNARRLVLIDSPGVFTPEGKRLPYGQSIKGAVREACVREGISSQFIVGNFKMDQRPKFAGRLNGSSSGRLKNAVLDLLLRQQGILYAPPSEIYTNAAKLDDATANQLDVIAFCRMQHQSPKLNYVLAVRLRAGGEVDVLLPHRDGEWLPYDVAAHSVGQFFADEYVGLWRSGQSPLRLDQGAMVRFAEKVLTERLERPTIAVIEAERWRNGRGEDDEKQCWTQLQNGNLSGTLNVLQFDTRHSYERDAANLDLLLAVVRLRMNDETPQYITADEWTVDDPMRDIPHLTGYVDPSVSTPLHYMSIAGLPDTQKDQKGKRVVEAFKGDAKDEQDNLAYKHAQIVEMLPFFVHPRYQHDEGMRQLCRCIHFLRLSPGFTVGEIAVPYPMHLGETLIEDMLCIIGVED